MSDYTLRISEAEIARYRMMAARALELEAKLLALAGVTSGATVADIGCGPAAMSVALAGLVGESGKVIGVERDASSLEAARQLVEQSGVANVELRAGDALNAGIAQGSVDVVMMRHVLAHNGGSEQTIVNQLADLVRPGGSVYLVDADLTGMRMLDVDPDLADLLPTYAEFHRKRGNDPMIGLRLGQLLACAGLDMVRFEGLFNIVQPPPQVRPPAWAARDAMLAEQAVDQATLDRWEQAFERQDAVAERPTLFAPVFIATGRRQT